MSNKHKMHQKMKCLLISNKIIIIFNNILSLLIYTVFIFIYIYLIK